MPNWGRLAARTHGRICPVYLGLAGLGCPPSPQHTNVPALPLLETSCSLLSCHAWGSPSGVQGQSHWQQTVDRCSGKWLLGSNQIVKLAGYPPRMRVWDLR